VLLSRRAPDAPAWDIAVLWAPDLPNIETVIVEVRVPAGPFGACGVSEPPIIPAPAAVANALDDATGTALWYYPGDPTVALRWVLLRDPAGQFEPHALFSTDPSVLPAQIVAWFVARWSLEVTCHEIRAHLGVETQPQWSDLAILRATPALLGLLSLVTLLAQARLACPDAGGGQPPPSHHAAWSVKTAPTFSDTLAFVRRRL
jgi:hypothetical protein